jgi:hypothetical protein
MITRFFKISRPFHYILFLLAITFIFFNQFYVIKNSWTLKIAITFLCLIISLFLVVFIITKNNLTQNNSFAAFYFCLFIFLFPGSVTNSDIIISNMFMLLAFRRILSLNSKSNLKKKYFDAGIWLCIAIFFFSWAVIFIATFLITIFLWRKDSFRHFIILALGLLSIVFLVILTTILFDVSIPELTLNYSKISLNFIFKSDLYSKISFFILFLFSGWVISQTFSETIIKPNPLKQLYIILFSIFLSSVTMSLTSNISVPQNFLFSFFPISIIAANFTQNQRTHWVSEFFIITIIVLSLTRIITNFIIN